MSIGSSDLPSGPSDLNSFKSAVRILFPIRQSRSFSIRLDFAGFVDFQAFNEYTDPGTQAFNEELTPVLSNRHTGPGTQAFNIQADRPSRLTGLQ